MSETIEFNGQTLYAPVIACRPVRPMDYPPHRFRIWQESIAEAGLEPEIYSNSVTLPCDDCGIAISMGPRSTEALMTANSIGLNAHAFCMLCALEFVGELEKKDGTKVPIRSLNNPEGDIR